MQEINKAIVIETESNLNSIDRARTLLNKSVLIGHMARQQPHSAEFTHERAIEIAKQALEIIKNRPEGKDFIPKEQYKLGEIIIISFHNIATELLCLKNEKQAYNLYRRAHELALRVLGPRHSLTTLLKGIVNKYKEQKNDQRRMLLQASEKSFSNKKGHKSLKKKLLSESKKYDSFFHIYGY